MCVYIMDVSKARQGFGSSVWVLPSGPYRKSGALHLRIPTMQTKSLHLSGCVYYDSLF